MNATLAIVGTDVRLTGHFVYSTLPDFKEAPPIRCTNRGQVLQWLADLGATEAADANHVNVPSISGQQLEMLLSSDPMFSRPELDLAYDRWREENGKLPDGRHYKNFFLVDSQSGAEKHIIIAEDSHRRDRRYAYKTVPEFGGFNFENGQAVERWLNFVVGKASMGKVSAPMRGVMKKGKARGGKAVGGGRARSLTCTSPPAPEDPLLKSLLEGCQQTVPPLEVPAWPGVQAPSPFDASALMQQMPPTEAAAPQLTGDEVISTFQEDAAALKWITDVPDCMATLRLMACTEVLQQAREEGSRGLREGSSTQEALGILTSLEQEQGSLSLRLLDASKITWAVSSLKDHPQPELAARAQSLTSSMHATATAVLERAESCMQ